MSSAGEDPMHHLSDRGKSFEVRLTDYEQGKDHSKRFTVSVLGSRRAALEAACQYRDKCLELPRYQNQKECRQRARVMGGVTIPSGLYYLEQSDAKRFWQAFLAQPDGTVLTKNFSVAVFGWEEAYRLAFIARAESKGRKVPRSIPVPPNPSFKDPLPARKTPGTVAGFKLYPYIGLNIQAQKGPTWRVYFEKPNGSALIRRFSVRIHGWVAGYRLAVATSAALRGMKKPANIEIPPIPEDMRELVKKLESRLKALKAAAKKP